MVVDFHSHILPGIDDGAESVQTSITMLQAEKAQGVECVVLTPHYYCERESIADFVERREKAFSTLQTAISKQQFQAPTLLLGAEVAMSSGLLRTDLSPLCISDTNVILLELPYHSDFRLRDVEYLINQNTLQVVFAHVERFYHLWERKKFQAIMKLPVYKQVNCGALYRSDFLERHRVLRWIEEGNVHLLGTDAHNITKRRVNMHKAMMVLQQKGLSDELDQMMQYAAQLVRPKD
jgi:protein-tyrosine phosphatase